jgi:peptidoglycan LD-endopeptidase CwlK
VAYKLSEQSAAKLVGVHPNMVKVVTRALEIGLVDFRVLEGVRTPARQKELYAQGRTKPGPKVTWTLKSNHFKNPKTGFGEAVDIVPLPIDWNKLEPFDRMAKAMFQASRELGIPIRWGADWDRDGKPRERGESDSPHFELA